MEITLIRQAKHKILVLCDGQNSHTFDLFRLIPNAEKDAPQPLDNPIAYGKAIYSALFPLETPPRHALERKPTRILLIVTDNELDAVAWEYMYGSYGLEDSESFLIAECHVVRGLPAEQRIAPPKLDQGTHIVAIPSNPLSHSVVPLNIDGEWMRLKDVIQELPYNITLERTRPPTLERLGLLIANQRQCIVHFMGHGGQNERAEAILSFEKSNGDLDQVTVRDFARKIHGRVFLVTLNACSSASPGETHLSNFAADLVRQKTPYTLGMRFSIPDDDALTFSDTFFSYLARGSSVEEAVYKVRQALCRNQHRQWMVGVPVLYTALSAPAMGFASKSGIPEIKEHQPHIQVSVLPRAVSTFQGRIDALKQIGSILTSNARPRIFTIHGIGGQGKTTIAREAVERFAYAWPGGVCATTLENLPSREAFTGDLARYLGIIIDPASNPSLLENQVLARLSQQRTLIVLDNAEVLIDAVEALDGSAIHLAQFIQQLPNSSVSLLVTSRVRLGWPGEVSLELNGLSPTEGAGLFRQSAPQRNEALDLAMLQRLSQRVDGHPLSLRLLGGAFSVSEMALTTFLEEYEEQLAKAENKYVGEQYRQRTLYSSLETSTRYLDEEHLKLLSMLWLFHSPFLPETAVEIFDLQPENADVIQEAEDKHSPTYDRLYTLWIRGLLSCELISVQGKTRLLYRLPPTMRPYIEHYLERADEPETLLARFGTAYTHLIDFLYRELDRGDIAAAMALLLREDLERGASFVTSLEQGNYLLEWGWILQRLGDIQHGLKLLERALEIGQELDRKLQLQAMNNIALVYANTGKLTEALKLFEQTLPIRREIGDRAGEAVTLNGMAAAYQRLGKRQEALNLFEQALSIRRELEDRVGEATTLSSMAELYEKIGKLQEALKLYEQVLPVSRVVGNRTMEAGILNNMGEVYRRVGKKQEALGLYQQALQIRQEVGDRARVATTLNNMGLVFAETGKPEEALRLFEQALLLARDVGERTAEAGALNNIAEVYRRTGKPEEALRLSEQALLLAREMGDRAAEATTLNNIAITYSEMGELQEALKLFEQALLLEREVGDRAAEATTLNNIAAMYSEMGKPQEALKLFEQVLPLAREVGDRAAEATTQNNVAAMYSEMGKPQEALRSYEQAVPIAREVGNRLLESVILNKIAYLYWSMQLYSEAQAVFEQSIVFERLIAHPAGEIANLAGLALLLYQHLDRTQEAIEKMEQALALFAETGLPRDAAGVSREELQKFLDAMHQGIPLNQATSSPAILSIAQVEQVVTNTVAVMTVAQDHHAEWREVITKSRKTAQQRGKDSQVDVDFFTVVLDILDAKSPTLPPDHHYTQAMAAIKKGIEAGGPQRIIISDEIIQVVNEFINAEAWETKRRIVEMRQEVLFQTEVETLLEQNIAQVRTRGDQRALGILEFHLSILRDCKTRGIAATFEQIEVAKQMAQQLTNLPFDSELIPRSIKALLGNPQEKLQHMQYLAVQVSQTTDEGLKALINSIQLALFGSPLEQPGQEVDDIYRQAWAAIVAGVDTAGG